MTINPIGATNPNQALDPSTFRTQMQQALSPVAQLFGESSDQLMSELDSGKTSLSALAQQKGVSQADLIDAIKSGLQQTAATNGQNPSDTQLTNIVNRIANHTHGGHHHHGGGGAAVASAPSTTSTTSTTPTTTTTTTEAQALLAILGAEDPSAANPTF